MNKPCYCCETTSSPQDSFPELDVALNELGMLSVTTESRKQYLQEMTHKCCPPPLVRTLYKSAKRTGGYTLFRMQREYVTSITTKADHNSEDTNSLQDTISACALLPSNQACSSTTSRDELEFMYESPEVSQNQKHSLKIRPTSRTKLRFLKPYEVPWQHQLEERVRTLSWNQEAEPAVSPIPAATTPAPSVTDDTAACNRSNPSSPAKVARPTTSSGLLRSRSLDDLVCPVWDKGEEAALLKKEEIETVSQQLMDLKVN